MPAPRVHPEPLQSKVVGHHHLLLLLLLLDWALPLLLQLPPS